jgi:antirestriction protein
MTTISDVTPRIYVACLAAYNNGHLHGAWIDATQDADDIQAEIQDMLCDSPESDAEEWAIHDHEGFCGIRLSEYEDIERVAELAQLLSEHGEAFAAYINNVGTSYASSEEFEESYQGCWASEEDFAYQQWEDCGQLDALKKAGINESYIDWERVARDLFIDDYYSCQSELNYGQLHIFTR